MSEPLTPQRALLEAAMEWAASEGLVDRSPSRTLESAIARLDAAKAALRAAIGPATLDAERAPREGDNRFGGIEWSCPLGCGVLLMSALDNHLATHGYLRAALEAPRD